MLPSIVLGREASEVVFSNASNSLYIIWVSLQNKMEGTFWHDAYWRVLNRNSLRLRVCRVRLFLLAIESKRKRLEDKYLSSDYIRFHSYRRRQLETRIWSWILKRLLGWRSWRSCSKAWCGYRVLLCRWWDNEGEGPENHRRSPRLVDSEKN